MFEITMPAIWPWSVKGSRWLTADRDLSWADWVGQFNWIVNWHQTTIPWNSSGNVYPCLSANWKSSFGRHVHPNHDARSSVATFGEISVNLHAPLANFNGARPIGPSNIPLRGENLIITRRMLIVWSNRNWNNLEIIRELNSLYPIEIRIRSRTRMAKWKSYYFICANEFAQQNEKTFVII